MVALLRSELSGKSRAPVFWLLGCGFLVLVGYVVASLVTIPRRSELGPVYSALAFPLAVVGALIACGSSAADIRDGHYEVLAAEGIAPAEYVGQKFLAGLALGGMPLLATAMLPVAMAFVDAAPGRELVGSYLGLTLSLAWGIAIGTAIGLVVARGWLAPAVAVGVVIAGWLAGDLPPQLQSWVPEIVTPRPGLFNLLRSFVDAGDVVTVVAHVLSALAGAWLVLELRKGASGLRGRARFVGAGAVAVAVSFGLAVGVGFTGLSLDVSPGSQFTLGRDARRAAAAVKSDTTVTAVYRRGQPARRAAERLLAALHRENGRIAVRTVSPETVATRLEAWGLDDAGGIVVSRGKTELIVTSADEVNLADALNRLGSGSQGTVCFPVFAGERSLDDGDTPAGARRLREFLEREGFQAIPLLQPTSAGLAPCAAVVELGPTRPLAQEWADSLLRYHQDGGAVVVFAEPGSQPLLHPVLAPLGAIVSGERVMDEAQRVAPGSEVVLALTAEGKGVTGDGAAAVRLNGGKPVLVAGPSSVSAEPGSPEAPVPLGLTREAGEGGRPGTLTVVGDADTVSNARFRGDNVAWVRQLLYGAMGKPLPAAHDPAVSGEEALRLSSSGALWLLLVAVGVPLALFAALAVLAPLRRRRRRWRRAAQLAGASAGLLAIPLVLGLTATKADAQPPVLRWGTLRMVVEAPAQIVETNARRAVIGVGRRDDLDTVIEIEAGPVDTERLANLNSGRILGRGHRRVGGADAQWIRSTNASGYTFWDLQVPTEGIVILTRSRDPNDTAVRRLLAATSFDDRFAVRTPFGGLLESLSGA
ncbi:MAG: DUF4350 domain-containing protein [Actinomycetota bacterium]